MDNPETNSILDKGNRLFLQGKLEDAITHYDKILSKVLLAIKDMLMANSKTEKPSTDTCSKN